MHKSTKYIVILLDEFSLNNAGKVIRNKNGYYNRFNKGDLVKPFKSSTGYECIQIPQNVRNTLPFHHLVWVLNHGVIPEDKEIDHINGIKTDNCIENLRLVTRSINNRNRKKRSDNTSGVTGIRWSECHQHYVIRRTIKGKRISRSRKTWDEALIVLNDLKTLGDGYTEKHGQ